MRKNIILNLENILLRLRIILSYFRNITKYLTEKEKIILSSLLIITLSSINILFTSALNYQSENNLEFTFNPTLSLSISGGSNGNLVIEDLAPGSSSDSNIINVNVSTNNVSGYNLSATTGSSTNTTTNLTHTNGTNIFTSLSTNDSYTSFSDDNIAPNTWGYSTSIDSGTTWSNYSGLPIYTTTGKQLNNTTTASNDTINFKIAAKASSTQVSGDYTNIINFTAIANQAPVSFYETFKFSGAEKYNGYYTMQSMTHSICEAVDIDQIITLIDVRDNQTYIVGKAKDNNCWMLQNLKLGKTTTSLSLTQADSNVDASGFTLNGKSSDGRFHKYIIDDVPNQNNSSEYYCTDDYGCYYNWYTATAGSGTSYIAEGNVDYSICSSNWVLPTSGPNGQLQTLYSWYPSVTKMLVDNPSTSTENITGKIPGFLLGGVCSDGGIVSAGDTGYYYSRTAQSQQRVYNLWAKTAIYTHDNSLLKFYGAPIRCLAQ